MGIQQKYMFFSKERLFISSHPWFSSRRRNNVYDISKKDMNDIFAALARLRDRFCDLFRKEEHLCLVAEG